VLLFQPFTSPTRYNAAGGVILGGILYGVTLSLRTFDLKTSLLFAYEEVTLTSTSPGVLKAIPKPRSMALNSLAIKL
jgi:hypothetical protein